MDEITHYIRESQVQSFVETGTFKGDSLEWIARCFPRLKCYSCDINPLYVFFTSARLKRFKNVKIWNQNSIDFLHQLLLRIREPALFWLDAHWLHDLPLNDEIAIILAHCKRPIIFIDDWKGNAFAQTVIDRLALPILLSNPDLEVRENESEHYCIIQRR